MIREGGLAKYKPLPLARLTLFIFRKLSSELDGLTALIREGGLANKNPGRYRAGSFLFFGDITNKFAVASNKKSRHFVSGFLFVARDGFEPPQTEPKSVVLPLDDRANSVRLSPNGTAKIIISQTFANHCCKKYANAVVITRFKAGRCRASGLFAPFEGLPFARESHPEKALPRPKGCKGLRHSVAEGQAH